MLELLSGGAPLKREGSIPADGPIVAVEHAYLSD